VDFRFNRPGRVIGVFTIGPLGPCHPLELRKISHMAKTYGLREVAAMENH